MNRLLLILKKLLLLLCVVYSSHIYAYDCCVDGVFYNLDRSKQEAFVTKSPYDNRYSGNIIIPNEIEYDGLTFHVSKILDLAFEDCSDVESISIGGAVNEIGFAAFRGCSSLHYFYVQNNSYGNSSELKIECSYSSYTTKGQTVGGHYREYKVYNYCSPFYHSPLDSVYIGKNINGGSSHDGLQHPLFSNNSSLKKVFIGNEVTNIGISTFRGCSGLTSVTIGNSVTSIGASAFYGCSGLTSVPIGNSVTSIGASAFYGCSGLASVTIPNSVIYIDEWAFRACSGLTEVTIGNSVTSIGNSAFKGCGNIKLILRAIVPPKVSEKQCFTSIEVPEHSTYLYARNEYWKDVRCIYTVKGGVRYYPILIDTEGENRISLNNSESDTEAAENSTVTISYNSSSNGDFFVFYNYQDITKALLNKGLYTFKTSVYHQENIVQTCEYNPTIVTNTQGGELLMSIGVDNLEKVKFLKVVGDVNGTDILTIRKMINLYHLDLEDANIVDGGMSYYQQYTTSKNKIGAYFFKDNIKLTHILLPKNLRVIDADAFNGVSNLRAIRIPNQVESIASSAFEKCDSLYSVEVLCPNVSASSFKNLSSIKVVRFGDDVRIIENRAFFGCKGLASINIPQNITSIDAYAFSDCNFNSVIIEDGTNELLIGKEGEYNYHEGRNIYKYAFDESFVESLYLGRNINESPFRGKNISKLIIGNKVTTISNSAFSGCNNLTSVIIPSSITSIGDYAFYKCIRLENLTVQSGNIGMYAFSECEQLEFLNLENGVREIGIYAFAYCNSLKSISTPTSVTDIGSGAFYHCQILETAVIHSRTTILESTFWDCISLKNVIIPNGVFSLSNTFAGCTSLKTVIIPNSVTSLLGTFSGCTSLESVDIPNGITELNHTFYNCKSLTSIHIPNSVTSLRGAFYGCNSLTSIIIPNSVTSLESSDSDGTFEGCSSLSSVVLPNNITLLPDETFRNCSSLKTIEIPHSVTIIYPRAFQCSGLTSVTIPSSVREVYDEAFSNCTKLKYVSLEDGDKISFVYYYTKTSPFVGCPIDSLYIGREVSRNINYGPAEFGNCESLKFVTLGKPVSSLYNLGFTTCPNIIKVISMNPTPPEMTKDEFNENTYQNATLYVPEGSKTLYWLHPYWEKFINIQEEVMSDIATITFAEIKKEAKNGTIYTLDGQKYTITNISDLPNGIYIINGKKVIIK